MTTTVNKHTQLLATSSIVLVAIALVAYKYFDYMENPWTRNGQVMAQVVQITPRVSGTIVGLPIIDNQFVKAGAPLFKIDPRTFQSELDYKEAKLDETIDEIEALAAQIDASAAAVKRTEADIVYYQQQTIGKKARLKNFQAEFKRYAKLRSSGATSQERLDQAKADFTDSEARLEGAYAEVRIAESAHLQAVAAFAKVKAKHGAFGDTNARLRRAKAAVHHAHLDLEFTDVRAPVDGYITNMNLRQGDHATANKPLLALVDTKTYWVYGFFKEQYLQNMRLGDLATVTLMGHQDQPIWGRITGRGWGIHQSDGSTASEGLPKISDSYEWIRQPQRVPVRVELGNLPEGVELRVGTNASVMIRTGTADDPAPEGAPPLL